MWYYWEHERYGLKKRQCKGHTKKGRKHCMKKQQKGFTIIEVVLVLAIAGLIFLMVFIALPALQRGQRDQARKNDVSTVASAVNTFKSNNRSSFGTVGQGGNGNLNTTTLRNYIDRLDQYDKASEVSVHNSTGAATVAPAQNAILVVAGAKCPTTMPAPGSANIGVVAGTSRTAAVVARLENNGSQHVFFCQDV